MRGGVRRLGRLLVARLGTLLIAFGAVLLIAGGAVQVLRQAELQAIDDAEQAPAFEASLRGELGDGRVGGAAAIDAAEVEDAAADRAGAGAASEGAGAAAGGSGAAGGAEAQRSSLAAHGTAVAASARAGADADADGAAASSADGSAYPQPLAAGQAPGGGAASPTGSGLASDNLSGTGVSAVGTGGEPGGASNTADGRSRFRDGTRLRFLPFGELRRPRFRNPPPGGYPGPEVASGTGITGAGTQTATVDRQGTTDAATAEAGESVPPERIIIPSLHLDRSVVEIGWEVELVDNDALRSVWQTAAHAAGFHRGSAPLGGAGNTVISGHNNIDGAVFAELHKLEPGARVTLAGDNVRREYEVELNFVVRETGAPREQRLENARWIGPTPDERLTLVTCYPPWGNTHRTIVVARPVGGLISGAAGLPPGRAR